MDKRNRSENHSAEKKARREKAWLFPAVLLFCAAACMAGLVALYKLFAPTRFSEREVAEYVRSTYGNAWTLKEERVEKNDAVGLWATVRYIYEDADQNRFSVYSLTLPEEEGGIPTGSWKKAMYDTYFSSMVTGRKKELEKLFRKAENDGGVELTAEAAGEMLLGEKQGSFAEKAGSGTGTKDGSGEKGVSDTGTKDSAGEKGVSSAGTKDGSAEKGGSGKKDGEAFCVTQTIFRLYLEDSSQLEKAAKYIGKADALLGFSRAEGKGDYSLIAPQVPGIYVYVHPDVYEEVPDAVSGAAGGTTEGGAAAGGAATRQAQAPEESGEEELSTPYPSLAAGTPDWKDPSIRDRYQIGVIPFTTDPAARYSQKALLTRLENDFADAARTFGKSFYIISDELRDKYPAPCLTLVNAGGHDLAPGPTNGRQYRLYYHRMTGTYWMAGLDPCEDYEGNPAGEYAGRGAFADLVKYLGGRYSPAKQKASWRIGGSLWNASLETKKAPGASFVYSNMSVYRDGNSIALDPVPDVFRKAGALPSGRPFSMRDLIRLLNVHITVNQKEMTAVMYRTTY